MDHAGLPLKTVLEQLDMLGELVVPVLRKEFDAKRPAHVPDGPTHQSQIERMRARESAKQVQDAQTQSAVAAEAERVGA